MLNHPPIWTLLGRTRKYVLTAYLAFGIFMGLVWLTAQLLVSRTSLTLAATVFLGGFGLLIVLIVMGVVAAVVAIQTTIIEEIARGRSACQPEDEE